MTDAQIFYRLHDLKPSLKSEVYDFIEFLLQKQMKNEQAKKPQFGCAKNKFVISKDFDAPLDDFKEYM